MKIIVVCEAVFPENKGGLERWIVWLSKSLNNYGHEVMYFNSKCINETRDGVSYVSLTKKPWSYSKSGKRSIFKSVLFGIRIYLKLMKIDYDVIYATQAPIISLFFIHAAKLRKKRKLIVVVEWLEIWPMTYWRAYLGRSLGTFGFIIQNLATRIGDKKVCFTESIYKKLKLSNPFEEILKLPGIVMENKLELTRNNNQKQDIIFLSRFVAEKQPFLAINSVIQFKTKGWNGTFYMIGTGPLTNKLSEYIKSQNTESYIKLLIDASDLKVKEIFKSSFVLLHPSIREGFGLSVIEAATFGVPSILLNHPENLSIEFGIVSELVCNLSSSEFIAEKLQDAYQNQENYFTKVESWIKSEYPSLQGTRSLSILDREIRSFLR